MAHPNEELLRRGYDAFKRGDMETMAELFADDITWHSAGDSPLSGEFHGQQEVFANFAKIPELTESFEMEIHDVLANDEHAVGLVTTRGEREGKTLAANAVHVYHVEDGQFTEAWIIQNDQAAADEFWG